MQLEVLWWIMFNIDNANLIYVVLPKSRNSNSEHILNALNTEDTHIFEFKPFAIILFLFFFKFLIRPGVIIESLRGRELFLSLFLGAWSVSIVFVGLAVVVSSSSICPKSISLLSYPRGRMTSKILPRLGPPFPRVSKMYIDQEYHCFKIYKW